VIRRWLAVLDSLRDVAPLMLRIVVGATFVLAGYPKITNYSQSVSQIAGMVPLGGLLAWSVPIVEFFGGLLLLAGLGTRVWSLLLAVTMFFAIAFVHGKQGFAMHGEMMDFGGKQVPVPAGWAFQATLLAACLSMVVLGAGRLSIDHLIRRRAEKPPQ